MSKQKRTNVNAQNLIFWACLCLFTALAAWQAFAGLGDGSVYDWDEARQGVNAYEMLRSGNYLVNTYDSQTDYWNVKPPLSMWANVAAYKLFGCNPMGLRFFSALSLPLSAAASMLFLWRRVGTPAALCAGFLFAATGTRFYHLFRTGDPDALFFLWCLLGCVFLYLAFQGDARWLVGAGLCTALGFLTKSMHVAAPAAVIALSLLLGRGARRFSARQLLLYLLLPAAAPVLLWAVLRFGQDGLEFFRQMLLLDVLNRVTSVVENHRGGPLFYITVLRNLLGGWVFWGVLLLIAAWIAVDLTSEKRPPNDKAFILIFALMFGVTMLIFTVSSTKLGWYMYPSLIGFYMLAAYGAQRLFDRAAASGKRAVAGYAMAAVCCLPVLAGGFLPPYRNIDSIASTSSADSVFTQLKGEDIAGVYYLVDTAGNQVPIMENGGYAVNMPQSWVLQGIYQGAEHRAGGLEAFAAAPAGQRAMLVVKYETQGVLAVFLTEHPTFAPRAQSQGFALLEEKES